MPHFVKYQFVFNFTRAEADSGGAAGGEIVRIVKTNAILKRPVNKLFAVENIYHDTKQTDKVSHKDKV